MEKRAELIQQRKGEPIVVIGKSSIPRHLLSDKFLNAWLQMRLTDMCNVVYKVKQYLWKVEKLDEDIDDKFAATVLDTIYQPCNYLKKYIGSVDMQPPLFFINMVKSCGGMNFKPRENFSAKINALKIEMEEFENPPSTYLRITKDEMKKFREEWDEKRRQFWKDNMAPELSPEEIEREMRKFDKALLKEQKKLIKSGKQPSKSFLAQQQKTRKVKFEELNRPKLDAIGRNAAYQKFRETMQAAEDTFKGVTKDVPLTLEEQAERDHTMKEFGARMADYKFRLNKQLLSYDLRIRDLSQVYWNRLAVMLFFLTKVLGDANGRSDIIPVKLAIAKVEMLNSRKVICDRIIQDEDDNCIASALLNVLAGIELFKTYYAEDIPLGYQDINLASSIILNKDVSQEEVAVVAEEQEIVQEEEELREQGFDIPEDDIDEENINPYDLEEYASADQEEEDTALFSMRGKRKKRKKKAVNIDESFETIKKELRDLDTRGTIEDLDALARFFIDTITMIKTTRMSGKVKTNRVNFFATLR